jgi:hypothetical protein
MLPRCCRALGCRHISGRERYRRLCRNGRRCGHIGPGQRVIVHWPVTQSNERYSLPCIIRLGFYTGIPSNAKQLFLLSNIIALLLCPTRDFPQMTKTINDLVLCTIAQRIIFNKQSPALQYGAIVHPCAYTSVTECRHRLSGAVVYRV